MGWSAAAIIGSAAIGAIGSSKASKAAASGAAQAGQLSEKQFQQTRADLAPWRALGGQATRELGALYALPYQQAAAPADPANPRGDRSENALARIGRSFNPRTGAQEFYPAKDMARQGRGGDTEVAHVTPGEMVVPPPVLRQPGVRNRLAAGFRREGMDPGRYVVGRRNSLNPRTGAREFAYAGSESGRTGFEGSPEHGGRSSYSGNPRDTDQDPDRRNRLLDQRRWRNQLNDYEPAPMPTPDPLPDDYFTQEAALARFYESPDYTTAFDEGAKAIEQSAAARGGLFSGNTGTALTRYGQQLGGNLYNQYANRLAAFANLGQTASTATGQFGANAAAQQGQAAMYGGQARAQGWEGIGNAINAGVGNYLFYDYLNR